MTKVNPSAQSADDDIDVKEEREDESYHSSDSDAVYPYKYAVEKQTSFYGIGQGEEKQAVRKETNGEIINVRAIPSVPADDDEKDKDMVILEEIAQVLDIEDADRKSRANPPPEQDDENNTEDRSYHSSDSDAVYPYKYAVQKNTSYYGIGQGEKRNEVRKDTMGKEINDATDTAVYIDWDHNDILNWVINLNEGLFNDYKTTLEKVLKEENVTGVKLNGVDMDAMQ